ncbi:MAG: Rv2993c-like domain-containing protein, partial [Ramlibacter sp.]
MSADAAALWVRFEHAGATGFGTLEGERVRVCEGGMFGAAVPTDRMLQRADVRLLMPVQPTKVIALWNNFHALGAKLNLPVPAEPLYLIKSPNSFLGPHETIRKPAC